MLVTFWLASKLDTIAVAGDTIIMQCNHRRPELGF